MYNKAKTILILSIAIILVIGCTADTSSNDTSNNDSDAQLEEVSVQLNWVFDSYWVGFYMAVDEGYYAEKSLDVTLEDVFDEEENYIDVVGEVTSGNAQFGITDTATLLSARADGSPVVAIATIYQRHPLAILSLAEKGIETPQDLVGKTAQISSNSMAMFMTLLNANGIDPEDVNIVERTEFTVEPIKAGEADVIDAWVTFEIPVFVAEGIDFNAIYPSDYGVDMYPDLIFTSEDMIKNNPELVQSFLEATFQGIRATIDNPELGESTILKWGSENVNASEVPETLSRAIPLFLPAGSVIGSIDPQQWEYGANLLVDMNILPEYVENAYTLEFLEAIYPQS